MQLESGTLVTDVVGAVEKHDVPPGLLEIEIVEPGAVRAARDGGGCS